MRSHRADVRRWLVPAARAGSEARRTGQAATLHVASREHRHALRDAVALYVSCGFEIVEQTDAATHFSMPLISD
jgi:hypothetical protein